VKQYKKLFIFKESHTGKLYTPDKRRKPIETGFAGVSGGNPW